MAKDQTATDEGARRVPWWAVVLFLFTVLGVLVGVLPGFRESVFGFLLNAFQLVFTPFILESTIAVGGFMFVVVVVTYLRMKEDKDEWIYLSKVDPDSVGEDEEIPASLQKRIDGVPFSEEKSAEQEVEDVSADTVEGYIRLRMFDEAVLELMKLTEEGESQETRRLRWMLERESKGEKAGTALLDKWSAEGLISDSDVDTWTKEL
ncbi:MAG: hypothetical protein AAGA58_05605 [Verrucomicrobiota bacterium]